ncbi:MAG: bifunctional alpha,alpha-trehalose-phosphate synthase (UDP-forming)/trehalose-phosphatase [Bacteroidota bacterium]
MPRLVIVSNRLPVTIDKRDGELFYHPSAGGLATGLQSLDQSIEKIWIGWPGKEIEDGWEQEAVRSRLAEDQLHPVFLTNKDIQLYYEGFSNKVIWPHFHYFTQYTTYEESFWEAYRSANQKFAEVVIAQLQEGDMLWVHDYQLMLLPGMVRASFPHLSIGFFLHIPFPSYELFRTLPWREQILNGLLGADQIGFHTFDYMRHFLSAVYRISGFEHNFGRLTVNNRLVNVDVFPMGIDYEKYAFPEKVADTTESSRLIQRLLAKKRKIIISIDRLDYTKGIPQRLRAFDQFLSKNPHYQGKVTLMLIVVPSRSNVDQYQDLKDEIDIQVGRIDGKYRTFGWSPIQYFFRSFSFTDLTALYQVADIAMITPLRDGMNLVAKEYVASKESSKEGVLILSEMAGAANELSDALLVNPQDANDMILAMEKALKMPLKEQKQRMIKMQQRLKKYDVRYWAETFLNQQIKKHKVKGITATNMLNDATRNQLIQDYRKAKKRLILLDYDGTLMPFFPDPLMAKPDKKLLELLEGLKSQANNKLVIISGRDRQTLGDWLGFLQLEMAAEHGVWRFQDNQWTMSPGLTAEWKADICPVLEDLVERTPGSFIEQKDFSVAWHYRNIDRDLGEKRVREFRDVLRYLTANLDLQVLEGNKVVEIKNAGVNKGKATLGWVNETDWDFIMAFGDDHTDEDTFRVLPPDAYSIKVGLGPTAARFNTVGVDSVRDLLHSLLE